MGLEPEGVQYKGWEKHLQKLEEGLQYKEEGEAVRLQNMVEKVELPYLSPAEIQLQIINLSLSIAHRWWEWQWERTSILLGWQHPGVM